MPKKKTTRCLKLSDGLYWNVIFFRGIFAKLEKQLQASQTVILKDGKLSVKRQ